MHFIFSNQYSSQPFESTRLVFRQANGAEKKPLVPDLKSIGLEGIMDAMNLPRTPEREAVKQKKKNELEDLKSKLPVSVNPKQQPRLKVNLPPDKEKVKPKSKPSVKNALEKAKQNVERDIFGKERLKDYINAVRGSIETLEPDTLRKFILAHAEYNADYRQWNADFCKTFKLPLKTGVEAPLEHRRYAYALQYLLADHFSEKGDVFQALKGKKASRFIYIDGKLGAYSVSVLSAYSNDKYSKSKEKPLPFSHLGSELAKKKWNEKIYAKDLNYLRGILDKPSSVNAKKVGEKTVPTAEKKVKGRSGQADKVDSKQTEAAKPLIKPAEILLLPKVKAISEKFGQLAVGKTMLKASVATSENRNDQMDDIGRLNFQKSKNPDTSFLDFENRKGSWPARIFREYKKLYEGRGGSEAGKANDPELVKKFNQLRDVVKNYGEQSMQLILSLYALFNKRSLQLFSKYEIPDDFDVEKLAKDDTVDFLGIKSAFVDQTMRVKYKHLRKPDGISKFASRYFQNGSFPTKTPKSFDSINDSFKGNSPSEKKAARQALADNLGNGNEGVALRHLSQIIKLRNMYHLRKEFFALRKDFDYDLNALQDRLDVSYDDFQENRKSKKPVNFAQNLIKGYFSGKNVTID